MTPQQRLASYRRSLAIERDNAALASYAREHHLAEARVVVERGDVPETVAHHRGQALILAKVERASRLRIAWYGEAIAALEAGTEPGPYGVEHDVEAGDELGMRVGG